MKIGIFTDSYYPDVSGLVSSIDVLKRELIKRGHDVYIFTTTNPIYKRKSAGVFRLPSMPFVFLKSRRIALFYAPKAATCVTKLNIDLIHTQTEFSLGIFGKIMAKRLGIPVVHTYHTLYKEYFYYISKGYFKNASDELVRVLTNNYCNGCNTIIAPTKKVDELLTGYGVKTPIEIIPTGIEIDRFDEKNYLKSDLIKIRKKLRIKEDDPVILFVGRIAKEKSIDVIIRQMPVVLNSIPNAKLVIIGEGDYREELEMLVDLLKINDSVIFTGEKPWEEIGLYYRIGDVFVSSSLTETQGLTFIEAMASGLPVIARSDKSIEGLIKDRENGVIFNYERELANAVIEVLNDKEYANSLVQNAKKTVKRYSAEEFGKSVEKVYEKTLEKFVDKKSKKKAKNIKKTNAKKIKAKMKDDLNSSKKKSKSAIGIISGEMYYDVKKTGKLVTEKIKKTYKKSVRKIERRVGGRK